MSKFLYLYVLLFGLALAGSFFLGVYFAETNSNQRYAKAQIVSEINDHVFFKALAKRDPSELDSIINRYILSSTESIDWKLENWNIFKYEFYDDVKIRNDKFRSIKDLRQFFKDVSEMSSPTISETNDLLDYDDDL